MTASCECLLAGFCARRNAKVALPHWEKCKSGAVDAIDGLYERFAMSKQSESLTQQSAPKANSASRPNSCGICKKKAVQQCSSCGRTGTPVQAATKSDTASEVSSDSSMAQ